MTEELSPADRSSLAAEQGAINMAVGGLMVFESDQPLTREVVARRIAERIHLVPRLRQRLEEPPLGIANPVWADDRSFDLDWHVRQVSLTGSTPESELGQLVGREFSHRLNRERPLWEATVIERLQDGSSGLLLKVHHALVDGVAAVAMAALVLDPTEEPLQIPPPSEPWEPRAYDVRRHLRRIAGARLAHAQRLMIEGLQRALDPDLRRAASDLRKATELAVELARTRPQAPMTPLNRPISPNRRYAIASTSLGAIKRAAREAGGTVNDTILAIVSGMLGRYLAAAGPEAFPFGERDPVALVPVSLRESEEAAEPGNRFSTVFVDLPVHEHELAVRIRRIAAQTSRLKRSAAVQAGAMMMDAAGWAPPLVSGLLARGMGQVRAFNLVVSNIPGPQQPFFLDGTRMRAVYPVVPLNPANQGLAVGIISYDGRVCFGLLADRDLEPPLSIAAAGLIAALGEIQRSVS